MTPSPFSSSSIPVLSSKTSRNHSTLLTASRIRHQERLTGERVGGLTINLICISGGVDDSCNLLLPHACTAQAFAVPAVLMKGIQLVASFL